MPWLRLDDRMYCNRKVVPTSLSEKCLWLWAMDYSADQLTDGHLRKDEIQMLAGILKLDNWQEVVEGLVRASLFEPNGEGYVVHDYLEYNPTREEVLAEREAAKERMRKVRDTRKRSGYVRPNITRSSDYVPVMFMDPVPSRPDHNDHLRGDKSPQGDAPFSASVTGDTPDNSVSDSRGKPSRGAARRDAAHFVVLAKACGYDLSKLTGAERGELNKAASQLCAAGYSPDEIKALADNYPAHFDGCLMTPSAIAKHASTLSKPAQDRRTGSTNPGKEYEPYINPKRA